MRWTSEHYEQIKAELARSQTVGGALRAFYERTGLKMGTGQLAKKFTAEGWDTPKRWLGTALPVASDAGVAQDGQRGESRQHEKLKGVTPDRPETVLENPPADGGISRERPYVAPPEREPWVQPRGMTRVLICPDIHLPYQHDLAWRTFLAVAKGWRPDALAILGDAVDFYCVSQHPKDPARRLTFEDEVRLGNEGLDQIEALRIPHVRYHEGNHCTRLTRYIAAHCREMHGIVDVRDLLRIKQRGWDWHPYGHHSSIGKLNFAHDIGFAGAYAARQSVMAMGASIIFGHTHRAASHYESTVSGERHVGHTMGWLGDPEYIDYRHRARVARESQHGFGIAYVRDDGLHWSHFVPIVDGMACVDGQVYAGRGT